MLAIIGLFAIMISIHCILMRPYILDVKSQLKIYYVSYIIFVIPILEEILFRSLIVNLCIYNYCVINWTYYKIGISIIFGLAHILNYYDISCQDIPKKYSIFQVINTTILGYILINLDNIIYAILYHSLYNFMGYPISYIIIKLIPCNNKKLINAEDPCKYHFIIKRRNSFGAIPKTPCNNSKYDIVRIPLQLEQSIKKYNAIIGKRIKQDHLKNPLF